MNKTLKELNLEDDFLFAKVMSDKEVCKELLENILEIEIVLYVNLFLLKLSKIRQIKIS